MKKIYSLFVFGLAVSLSVNAQKTLPEMFETAADTADWEMFENGSNDAENFVIVANPDNGDVNTSANCLMFTVVDEAQPWAGASSKAFGELEFTDENHTMTMMVYKSVISRCLLKVEMEDGTAVEVFVENTVTDEWELLTFDFSAAIGNTYTVLVFFPDFPESRTEGSENYIDNIGWEGLSSVKENMTFEIGTYPNPANDLLNVNAENLISSVNLIDVTGKTLISVNDVNSNTLELNVSNLNAGLYVVNVTDVSGKSSAQKVQIK